MSFFDDKEEILAVELTDYGKYLLKNNKFDPKYYAFYDDDVIYDIKYTNLSESQNSAQERIINKTAIFKPIVNNTSITDEVKKLAEAYIDDTLLSKAPDLNDRTLLNSLGTCDYNSDYAPAWSVSFLTGSLQFVSSGSAEKKYYRQNSQFVIHDQFVKIPQINVKENICLLSEDPLNSEYIETIYFSEFDERIYYNEKSVNNTIILEEKNGILAKENFSIEVFMQEENKWKQLYFNKDQEEIKNNLLLDNSSIDISRNDKQYAVDTYLTIYLDGENVFFDNSSLEYDLYTSNITPEDDC